MQIFCLSKGRRKISKHSAEGTLYIVVELKEKRRKNQVFLRLCGYFSIFR